MLFAIIFVSVAVTLILFKLDKNGEMAKSITQIVEGIFVNESADVKSSSKITAIIEKDNTQLTSGERMDFSYLDDTVFIGDSRTNAMAVYGLFPPVQVFAEDGLNHQSARTKAYISVDGVNYYTISQALLNQNPNKVYIGFGINGIGWLTTEEFFSEYVGMIQDVRSTLPNAKIVITSILPVSRTFEQIEPTITNSLIDEYNGRLLSLAKEQGVYYLDTASGVKDGNNGLNALYDSGDGLHLNKAAYSVIFDTILTHPI